MNISKTLATAAMAVSILIFSSVSSATPNLGDQIGTMTEALTLAYSRNPSLAPALQDSYLNGVASSICESMPSVEDCVSETKLKLLELREAIILEATP